VNSPLVAPYYEYGDWRWYGAAHRLLLGAEPPPQRYTEFDVSPSLPFPEYQHGKGLYAERLPWLPITLDTVRDLWLKGLKAPPLRLPPLPPWTRSKCHPLAMRFMADQLGGFFDARLILDMLTNGVQWRLRSEQRLRGARGFQGKVGDEDACAYLREVLLPKALAQGKLHAITDPVVKARCIYSPIFLVEKSNREIISGRRQYRICQDLSAPLQLLDGSCAASMNADTPLDDLPSVPLGTASHIIAKLVYARILAEELGHSHRDIRLVAIDLTDAYYQWLVEEGQQECVAFEFDDCCYVHNGLPFGSCLSPSCFCRFMHLVWCYLEQVGYVLCNWYMDDGIIISITQARALRDHAEVLRVLSWMGVDTNVAKSMAAPATQAVSLGFVFDVDAWTVAIKPSTVVKAQAAISALLEKGPTFRWPARTVERLLESLAGLLCFIEQVIPTVAPVKRHVFDLLHGARKESHFSIGYDAMWQLRKASRWLSERNSSPIRLAEVEFGRAPRHRLHTDASGGAQAGFGAWVVGPDGTLYALRGLWRDLTALPSDLTIADMELLVILLALQLLLPKAWPTPSFVRLSTDNTNAKAWLNSLQCKADSPNRRRRLGWLEELAEFLFHNGMVAEAEWLCSEANALADALSRPEKYHLVESLLPADVSCIVYVQVPPAWAPPSLRDGLVC
jgi:hypothetical protein